MAAEGEQPTRPRSWRSVFGVSETTAMLEHAQDVLALLVGVVLIVLAVTLLVTASVDFLRDVQHHSIAIAGENLLDRVLLVLILAEIVHTVVLSLRARTVWWRNPSSSSDSSR